MVCFGVSLTLSLVKLSHCSILNKFSKIPVNSVFKGGHIALIRFCGTTKMTSQKDNLMKSFIRQIEAIFKFTVLGKDELTVLETFERACEIASENQLSHSKLIFVIDSIGMVYTYTAHTVFISTTLTLDQRVGPTDYFFQSGNNYLNHYRSNGCE